MKPAARSSAPLHGALLLAIVCITAWVLPSLAWPWYLLLPLLAYSGVVLISPPLRRTAPRITVGRLGGAPLACAAVLSVATTLVLLAFDAWAQPDTTELAAQLPTGAFGHLMLAGVFLSLVNATLEEVIFRGLFWEAIAAEWNVHIALLVTAALFGLGHLGGYPPGPLGAVLAGGYGVALGLLRWWTGGLGLAIGCHVCADATIFGLLLKRG